MAASVLNFVFCLFCCFVAFSCHVVTSTGDDDYEGLYSLTVEHTFDSGLEPEFTKRGVVMVRSLKSGLAEFVDVHPLTFEQKAQLRALAESDRLYRIRVSKGSDEATNNYIYSFLRACALYESHLSDHLTIHIDQSGNLIATSITTSIPYCSGDLVVDNELNQFNGTVDVQQTVLGPAPETQAYIQKMEQEKMEKAKGQQGDNRSFFAKYNNVDPNAGQGRT